IIIVIVLVAIVLMRRKRQQRSSSAQQEMELQSKQDSNHQSSPYVPVSAVNANNYSNAPSTSSPSTKTQAYDEMKKEESNNNGYANAQEIREKIQYANAPQ